MRLTNFGVEVTKRNNSEPIAESLFRLAIFEAQEVKIQQIVFAAATVFLLSGCATNSEGLTGMREFAKGFAKGFNSDCRVPTVWDPHERDWVIDVQRVRTKDGRPLPTKWDPKRNRWVIDYSRLRYDDLDFGCPEDL